MVIIDTGPIVSLFDKSEPYHDSCKSTLKQINTPLITTWPVLTESFYLLSDWYKGQMELWDFILSGGIQILDPASSSHYRIKELMEKYADQPMDLADASLVIIAETHRIETIFTLDKKDFSIYRPKHCQYFKIIPA